MDDISSFARTLTKLERLMAKLDMAVSNTRCMFGIAASSGTDGKSRAGCQSTAGLYRCA